MEFGECHMCGYPAKSEEEVRLWKLWGCCRIERKEVEHGIQARTCRQASDGSWIAPQDDPEMYQDPQAFKEAFMQKYKPKPKKEDIKPKKDGTITK